MADNVSITAGTGTVISTEEVTTLNGAAVAAQQVQRVITASRTADGVALDGTSLLTRLDQVNDAVTNYPFAHSFSRIAPVATATTVTAKTGAGAVAGLTIGVKSTGAATVTLYDSTTATGTIITQINTTDAGIGTITLNAAFAVGLTIATSTSTTGADLTVMWR